MFVLYVKFYRVDKRGSFKTVKPKEDESASVQCLAICLNFCVYWSNIHEKCLGFYLISGGFFKMHHQFFFRYKPETDF